MGLAEDEEGNSGKSELDSLGGAWWELLPGTAGREITVDEGLEAAAGGRNPDEELADQGVFLCPLPTVDTIEGPGVAVSNDGKASAGRRAGDG